MSRRTTIILIALALVCQPSFSWAATGRPNLILIMADDLGYETIGANGGESYKTPHLDALAANGMRFEQCYVQPLCTPTRVQLMTGRYNVRNYAEFGRLDWNATTFANLLKKAGYATGIAGKWQLGRGKNLPHKFGFDESYLWQHTRRPPRYSNPGIEHNGEEHDFDNGEFGPKLVNDFALDFVTRHEDEPFFLYYPMILTHAPFVPTPDSADWDPTARGEKNSDAKYFGDMVTYMDKMVGQLVAKLDELGIRDHTMIIFLGDNGTGRLVESQFKGRTFRGGKGLTTAAGMHVPLIVNWPGHVAAGKVSESLVDSTDFLPTLCAAAGAEVPASLSIDGKSFLPELLGQPGEPREWIYSWYSQNGGPTAKAEFAMTADLKVYRDGKIFDLKNDALEQHPLDSGELSPEQSKTVQTLKAAMSRYADARPPELLTADAKARKKNAEQRPERKRRKGRARATNGE